MATPPSKRSATSSRSASSATRTASSTMSERMPFVVSLPVTSLLLLSVLCGLYPGPHLLPVLVLFEPPLDTLLRVAGVVYGDLEASHLILVEPHCVDQGVGRRFVVCEPFP